MATESGWVIERGDSEVSAPLYWTGQTTGDKTEAWNENHMLAVRFSRHLDAEVVAMNLMGRGPTRMRVRICEHGWG